MEQVKRARLKPVHCGFFSRSGYDLKESYPYSFYTLEDLYR